MTFQQASTFQQANVKPLRLWLYHSTQKAFSIMMKLALPDSFMIFRKIATLASIFIEYLQQLQLQLLKNSLHFLQKRIFMEIFLWHINYYQYFALYNFGFLGKHLATFDICKYTIFWVRHSEPRRNCNYSYKLKLDNLAFFGCILVIFRTFQPIKKSRP